jgi:tetratricopeptide (TPR) repeat protein
MLVVLDNARDSAQVRPLLPGAPGCLVLVTSRNLLTGLAAADGAQLVDLDLPSVGEARELLAQRLGAGRVAAEPDAIAEVITRCARLPLALALVAAQAAVRPRVPLRVLTGELGDAQRRWDTLTSDDPAGDARMVFSWSYHALSPPAARLFRLLGLHPGPDISAPVAASLAGTAPEAAKLALAELTQASLLAESAASRYTCHDLLRAYATQLTHTLDTDAIRHTATGRVLDHYLHTAYRAASLLEPTTDAVPLAPPRAGVTPDQLNSRAQAMDWFTVQRAALLAAVPHAAASGFDTHAWQLASALGNFLNRRGHWPDQVAVQQVAVAAAQRLADPLAEARARRRLAGACILLDRFDDAFTQLRDTLDLATRIGDQTLQAETHFNLAFLWERQAQPAQALHHAQQTLRLHQSTGNQDGQANALNMIGWCHVLLGEHEHAVTYCQQAITLFQQLGDPVGQAASWDSLGYAHHHRNQYAEAVTCYQRALSLSRDLGDSYEQAITLTHLGDAHRATDALQDARDVWQQALTILEERGHPSVAEVREKLAVLDSPTDRDKRAGRTMTGRQTG